MRASRTKEIKLSELLQLRNDGPKIVECNFWTLLNTGKIFVSVNAAACHAFQILGLPRYE